MPRASGSANARKKGKNKASTSDGNDSLENSGEFDAEQMALYKAMHRQFSLKRKAVTVAEDEGMSILFSKAVLVHN